VVRVERVASGWGADTAVGAALQALVKDIERRLAARGIGAPPDAFLLGQSRHALIDALRRGVLAHIAAIHWPTFTRVAALCTYGIDGLCAAVGLSMAQALASEVSAEVIATLDRSRAPAPSVLFRRVTRPTRGHVIFASQVLRLAEGEFGIVPLEMTGLLQRHTPAAIRAMLQARLLKGRPDLDREGRDLLIGHTAQYLGRLLPESQASRLGQLLLRLAYYRLHHASVAMHAFNRLRIVDFSARRSAATDARH
jgi:hypothetical protein